MGCVMGKRASAGDGGGRRKGGNDERKASESAASDAVQEEGKEERIESSSAEAPPPPEFRLKRGISARCDGWPSWLNDVAGHVIKDWKPRGANTFEKLDKIGQGTYSNVYKARDLITGKVVALKKVRFDNLEPETVRFMAREILVLRRLDHPNVIKLQGLVISRMSTSLYLVFDYMEHDLAGLTTIHGVRFTEPQVKCYMKQLISGLEHCHNNGILHRDIKCSNLLIDNDGNLQIADFGLASFFDPECNKPMTSRVITLWYRPPELLLGASYYGVAVDLWSAGCILAELFAGKPILRGRTEVEQLHKIFKLCGSPPEEYWKKTRLPNVTLYKPQQPYKCCIVEAFRDFPPSALALVETLLAIDPDVRGTATAALNSEFFTTEPFACKPSSLPKFPPSKEMDIKLRDEAARRQQGIAPRAPIGDGSRRARPHERVSLAVPAPEANAELQVNLNVRSNIGYHLNSFIVQLICDSVQRLRMMSDAKIRSKSDKFPPPHQDAAVGHPMDPSHGSLSFAAPGASFTSSVVGPKYSRSVRLTTSKSGVSRKKNKDGSQRAPSRGFINAFYPSSVGWDFRFGCRHAVSCRQD